MDAVEFTILAAVEPLGGDHEELAEVHRQARRRVRLCEPGQRGERVLERAGFIGGEKDAVTVEETPEDILKDR
jgi:hypothetical protein